MSYTFKDLHWAKDISLKEYLLPKSLGEALEMLAHYDGRAMVVAGGTDIVPLLRRRDIEMDALVDITRLPDMDTIEEDGADIVLGAAATHARLARSLLIQQKAGLLADGARAVGSPQIRNIGTVGGNLASAQPAGDTVIPLLALDASATLSSRNGERIVPLADFFVATGKTVLDPAREIMTRIRFKALGENRGGHYLRLSKRRSLSLPILVAAVVVKVDSKEKIIEEASVALGPVAPVPFRASGAEGVLRKAPVTLETIERAALAAMEESNPRDSCLRCSCVYRREMVKVLVKRCLRKSLEQAGCPVG